MLSLGQAKKSFFSEEQFKCKVVNGFFQENIFLINPNLRKKFFKFFMSKISKANNLINNHPEWFIQLVAVHCAEKFPALSSA